MIAAISFCGISIDLIIIIEVVGPKEECDSECYRCGKLVYVFYCLTRMQHIIAFFRPNLDIYNVQSKI